MQSIENVALECVMLHTADSSMQEPRLADRPVELDDGLRAYFEEHIRSCARSSQVRIAKFLSSEGAVASACDRMIEEGPDCFIAASQAIGWWLHEQVARENGVTADLAVCPFIDVDNEQRYIGLLKLDPMRVYLRRHENGMSFEQILVLPNAAHGLATWALVRATEEESRYDLLYRVSPDVGFWTSRFLECEEIATPRQMTRLVLSETSKWLEDNAESVDPNIASDLTRAVRETAQTHMMDLEELAERVIPNSIMREEYIGRMLDKGLTETRFQPDSDWAERQARKTTYVLDHGITITGPSDVIDEVVQLLPKTDDGKTRIVIETKKFREK